MLSLPDAIGIAAISMPVCMFVWRHKVQPHVDQIVLLREFQDFRSEARQRLTSIERDIKQMASALGVKLMGS